MNKVEAKIEHDEERERAKSKKKPVKKLDIQHKHIMRLLARDAGNNGWVPVSNALYPILSKSMPPELTEFQDSSMGKRARLTEEGKSVLSAMKWL